MTRPRQPWTAEETALVRKLDAQGHNYREIARAVRRHSAAVHNWMAGNIPGFRERERDAVAAELRRSPHATARAIANAVVCPLGAVARVRGQVGLGAGKSHDLTHGSSLLASPVSWLDQPSGRIKALRAAHGIDIR